MTIITVREYMSDGKTNGFEAAFLLKRLMEIYNVDCKIINGYEFDVITRDDVITYLKNKGIKVENIPEEKVEHVIKEAAEELADKLWTFKLYEEF